MHPPLEHAYAYRFDHERVSVVFSGDTAPSEVLAEFCSRREHAGSRSDVPAGTRKVIFRSSRRSTPDPACASTIRPLRMPHE